MGGEPLDQVGTVPADSLEDNLEDRVGYNEGFDADSQSKARLPAARKS